MTGNIRIKQSDRNTLNDLKEFEKVQMLAYEQGITDDPTHMPSFEQMMELVIPEDGEPISRPEDEMSWQDAGGVKGDILDLAGENVSVHEVVSEFTHDFIDEHNLDVEA